MYCQHPVDIISFKSRKIIEVMRDTIQIFIEIPSDKDKERKVGTKRSVNETRQIINMKTSFITIAITINSSDCKKVPK